MRTKRPLDYQKALERMAGLCARSEQCEFDIASKLRRAGLGCEDSRRVINYLIDNSFIDNNRFAKAYALDKSRFSGHGRLKIRMDLKMKRISDSDITEAFAEIDPDEYYDTLLRLGRAKASDLNLTLYEDRIKLYRCLATRGYESDLIQKVINSLRQTD